MITDFDTRFYVYELIDPRTNLPFYVGKGSGKRAYAHVAEAAKPRAEQVNTFKCAIINNIIGTGKTVIVKIVQSEMSETAAYSLEEELIARYGRKDASTGEGILTNVAEGGLGGKGCGKYVCQHTLTGALIQTYRTLTEAAFNLNINKSTICAALNGRTLLAAGFRWSYLGDILSPYDPQIQVPVDQFDLNGIFLKSYGSIKQAAKDNGIKYGSMISNYLTQPKMQTAGGYRWAYKGEQPKPFNKESHVPPRCKVYQCFTKDGESVGEYETIKEAVAATPANPTGIVDCCAGRKKSSGGLVWKVITK